MNTKNFQVNVLCKKDVMTRDYKFNQDALHHNHCDKNRPISFTYSFGVK